MIIFVMRYMIMCLVQLHAILVLITPWEHPGSADGTVAPCTLLPNGWNDVISRFYYVVKFHQIVKLWNELLKLWNTWHWCRDFMLFLLLLWWFIFIFDDFPCDNLFSICLSIYTLWHNYPQTPFLLVKSLPQLELLLCSLMFVTQV